MVFVLSHRAYDILCVRYVHGGMLRWLSTNMLDDRPYILDARIAVERPTSGPLPAEADKIGAPLGL